MEFDDSGNPVSINLFGPDGLEARQDLAGNFFWNQNKPSGFPMVRHFTYDPQGNLVQRFLDDVSGNFTVETSNQNAGGYGYVFDAFGDERQGFQVSDASDQVGFGGQYGYYTDIALGLDLMTHRHYNPSTGRWVTRDPIGYSGGLNLYAFCGNNPVTRADPSGFNALDDAQRWVGEKVDQFNTWLGRHALAVLTAGTKFDHSKQPTLADANDENPSAAAIKQGGRYIGGKFIPAFVGGAIVAAVTGPMFKPAREVSRGEETTEEAGAAASNVNLSWKSVKTWGHTFSKHGAGMRMFKNILGEAKGTGEPRGQWLNNEAAANFLKDHLGGKGSIMVEIPEGLGQVIHPDGMVQAATEASISYFPNGMIRSAYPVIW